LITAQAKSQTDKLNQEAIQKTAEATELATRSLSKLERNVTDTERVVAKVAQAVKDAEVNVTNANAKGTPADQVAAKKELERARSERDAKTNGGEFINVDGKVEVVLKRNSLEATKDKLEARKTAIRNTQGPINDAEDALKMAGNAVITEDNRRRTEYAKTVQGQWAQNLDFLNAGGENAQREAAIRFAQEYKRRKK